MITRQILLAALILYLAIGFGQANLTISHQVCPDQIWPTNSEKETTSIALIVVHLFQNQTKFHPV